MKKKVDYLYDLYVKIRTWLQPYYIPKPKKEKIQKVNKKSKKKGKKKSISKKPINNQSRKIKKQRTLELNKGKLHIDTTKNDTDKVRTQSKSKSKDKKQELSMEERLERNMPLMDVVNYPKSMEKAYLFKNKPKKKIWYYHDTTYHQIFARLEPGQGFMATSEYRDDVARKHTHMLIRPVGIGAYDRTHIIPFGYVNTETDNRLIIGWDSNMNRNVLADFEKKQKYREVPIYWFTQIRRTDYGAEWSTVITDENTRILDTLTLRLKCNFVWLE